MGVGRISADRSPGCILLAGALCDRFGRRRVFVIGVTWFAIASLICAIASNIELLIAARGTAGGRRCTAHAGKPRDPRGVVRSDGARPCDRRVVGPRRCRDRDRDPLLGGFLITAVSWRLIFLINAPIAPAVCSSRRATFPNRAIRTRPATSTSPGARSPSWRWSASRTGSSRDPAAAGPRRSSSPRSLGRNVALLAFIMVGAAGPRIRSSRSTSSDPSSSAPPMR